MRIALRICLCALFALCNVVAGAHSGKARFHVIVDTDGAADDLRTLCMLLGYYDVEVLAITASEGALTPKEAASKVTALLRSFYHEGIPVGEGRALGIKAPAWRKQSQAVIWGAETHDTLPSAKDVIINALTHEEEKVTIICLGALTNVCDVLQAQPALKERISEIVWYNSSANPLKGSNYDADRKSADAVLASGLKVNIISANADAPITVDKAYIDRLGSVGNVYAEKIALTHLKGALKPVVAAAHMQAWDELCVAWLVKPTLFNKVSEKLNVFGFQPNEAKIDSVAEQIALILVGKEDSESRVFKSFPTHLSDFAPDIAPIVGDVISRYGFSEWRAGVLANELHGHLGIYAIIGVKMGIRAREYFNIGVDDMKVTSFAGSQPPVSCMNDGLQVSTGATLGHGLIHIVADSAMRPEASFSFKERALRLRLKADIAQQIRNDVREGIRLHGNLTEPYWQYIRALAIRYWRDFDRHEIFEFVR